MLKHWHVYFCAKNLLYHHIISYHNISFIFIRWICTGLQNPYGYGKRQICLRNLEVKSI